MKRIACCLVVLVAVCTAWPVRTAEAAEPGTWVPTGEEVRRAVRQDPYTRTPATLTPRKRWAFEFRIPAWIPGVSGDFASGGIEVDADRDIEKIIDSFFDIATDLDFAFVGSFVAQTGPWTFAIDGFGAVLGNNITFKLVDGTVADAEISAFIGTARVGYRVGTVPFCLFGSRSCLKVDAYAGARWYYADYEVKLPTGAETNDSGSWVDPIVGFNAELGIGRHWVVHLWGDIGGFDVGSELAFWVVPSLEYRFTNVFSMALGWAYMTAKYEEGSGADRFAWNLSLSGPQLVLGFRF